MKDISSSLVVSLETNTFRFEMQTLSVEIKSKVLTWMTQITHWYRPTDPEDDPDVIRIIYVIVVLIYSYLLLTSYPIETHAIAASYSKEFFVITIITTWTAPMLK